MKKELKETIIIGFILVIFFSIIFGGTYLWYESALVPLDNCGNYWEEKGLKEKENIYRSEFIKQDYCCIQKEIYNKTTKRFEDFQTCVELSEVTEK